MRERTEEKFLEPFKDMLGRSIEVGEYFAYPLGVGRSSTMAIFQLIEAEVWRTETTWERDKGIPDSKYTRRDYKVKAQKITSVWAKNYTDRPSILHNCMNALKIPAEDVEAWRTADSASVVANNF